MSEATTREIGPAGFIIEGTNAAWKELYDFLSFVMAALFGAAASSLFEQMSTALRLRTKRRATEGKAIRD